MFHGRTIAAIVGCLGLFAACASDLPHVTGAVFGKPVSIPECNKQGMALAIEGNCLYVGAGPTLYVYDISGSPLRPQLLGQTPPMLGAARQVAVQNGIAYMSARESGLWIIDCRNPQAPKILTRYDCCELATGVDVAGDVCFLGQRQNGVEFIDVSDPAHPAHIAMRKTDESQSVKYRDGFCYSGDWHSGRLTVFDCRDMSNIRQTAYEPLYGYGDGVWLQGRYLFAATGHNSKNRPTDGMPEFKSKDGAMFGTAGPGTGCGHGLDIFDISDPAHPRHVSRTDFPPFYARGLDFWTPRTSGNLVFCAQTHNGVFALDITDKTKPRILDRIVWPDEKHPEWPGMAVGSVAVGDGVLYVAVCGAGVQAVPAKGARREPFAQGTLPKNASFREPYPNDDSEFWQWLPPVRGQARGLAVRGDHVYAACGDAGLYVLKVRPEGGLQQVGRLEGVEQVFDVAVWKDRIFVAEGFKGWGVYTLEGPTRFREIARLKETSPGNDFGFWVWSVNDDYAMFSARRGGDWLVDLRDLSHLKPILSVSHCPGWDKYMADRPVGGGRWLAHNAAITRIDWIDLAAKPKPVVIHTQPGKNRISLSSGICAFGDKAFLTNGGNWLITDGGDIGPDNGNGKWEWTSFASRASGIPRADGTRIVMCNRINRFATLHDFSDPSRPRQLKSWKFSGNPDIPVFHNGRVLIPCGYQGVLMQKAPPSPATATSGIPADPVPMDN